MTGCLKNAILLTVAYLAGTPALAAEYHCRREARVAENQYVHITVATDDRAQKTTVHSEWSVRLGSLPKKGRETVGLLRSFRLSYEGPVAEPWRAVRFRANFPTYLKMPLKPLFVFLTLESGERFQRRLTDSRGVVGRYLDDSLITDETVANFDIKADQPFLSALEKAHSMAVDFIYSDGEILQHGIYQVSPPTDVLQRTLEAALEMQRDYKTKCELYVLEIQDR